MGAPSDSEVQQLLNMYEAMGGQAPEDQPELQVRVGSRF